METNFFFTVSVRIFLIQTLTFTMNLPRFTPSMLAQVLQAKHVSTLSELSSEFDDCSHRTVHRKLKSLDYLSSYSHRGKYYTLRSSARFDSFGLWFYKDIRFSRHGTLSNTLKTLVESSPLGYRCSELDAILRVRAVDALGKLVRDQKLHRVFFQGQYIYCSLDPAHYKRQMNVRRMQSQDMSLPVSIEADLIKSNALALFFSLLHEKHRRLFAGLLSVLWGYGGDLRVERLLGISRKTVQKGRVELNSGPIDPHRIRKPGGGRPSCEKKL